MNSCFYLYILRRQSMSAKPICRLAVGSALLHQREPRLVQVQLVFDPSQHLIIDASFIP